MPASVSSQIAGLLLATWTAAGDLRNEAPPQREPQCEELAQLVLDQIPYVKKAFDIAMTEEKYDKLRDLRSLSTFIEGLGSTIRESAEQEGCQIESEIKQFEDFGATMLRRIDKAREPFD